MTSNNGFLREEQQQILRSASQGSDLLCSLTFPNSSISNEEHPTIYGATSVENYARGGSGKYDKCLNLKKNDCPRKGGCSDKRARGELLDTGGDLHVYHNDPNYGLEECSTRSGNGKQRNAYPGTGEHRGSFLRSTRERQEPNQLFGTTVSEPLEEYKGKVRSIIEEYFATDDVAATASDLDDLGCPNYHHYFVKKLISISMDRHDREKEMAAVLLSSLYADVVEPEQVMKGFSKLLESADDLALDIPDAVDILALFVARAVIDDIIPRAFLTKTLKSLPEDSKRVEIIRKADKSYLSAPLHAEIIERRWGGSTHITVEEMKKKITDLLYEYVESGDKVDACQCIRNLNVPFFHHEVVKKALILAMERRNTEPIILDLLKEAAEEGLITSGQMSKGFGRLEDTVDDLSPDILNAKDTFQSLILKATTEGWFSPESARSTHSQLSGPVEDDNVRLFKERARTIIKEYFLSDDILEVVRSLEDLAAADFNALFIKKLIMLAMDHKNREKEMASVLLAALCSDIFPVEDIVNGFVLLLESAEDTALDIPDASKELAFFLARAVIDDILAPLNLKEISRQLKPESIGHEIIHMSQSLLSARLAGERILRCWGGGTGWAVEDAKDNINKLLEEYEAGGDLGGACQCVRDLNMPFFHHEVVKKALVMAMEKKNDRVLNLLQESSSEGLITISQMVKGFTRVADSLDDLALDLPNAREKYASYVEQAKLNAWLISSFTYGPKSDQSE